MTSGNHDSDAFARTSARIGLNLVALVGSRFLSLALTLVQMGIIFRGLDVEGRGLFGFSMQYVSLFTVFATLGIQRLLVRDIAREPAIAWTHVWTALLVVLVLSTFVFGVIVFSCRYVETGPHGRASILFAAVWVVVLWAWQRPFEGLLIARERIDLVSLVNILSSLLKVAAVYVFMQTTPSSAAAHAAIAVATAAAFLLCAGFAVGVGGWERPRFQPALALRQLRECYPFTVAMLCSLVYFKSDMTLLKFLAGDTATGIYTPPQRVMEPILMIAGLWGTAVFPALCRFSHASAEYYASLKKTSLRLALIVSMPMGFGLALLAGPVIHVLTGDAPETNAAVPVLQVLALMLPFFYANGIAQEFFYSAHRNWFVVFAYAIGAVVNVAGNLTMIPAYGALGAAGIAVVTNALISAILVFGLRAELGSLRLPSVVLKGIIACAAMSATVLLLSPLSIALAVTAGAAVYTLVLYGVGVLDPLERGMLRGMLRAVLKRELQP